MLRALLKEPLVHFLVLGLIIFAVYHALNRSNEQEPDKIVVTQARIEQLAGLFAKTWQRPPIAAELKGLIDDYVKEEILYREALALGLDNDDTVIRRRLRQKMEFLSDTVIGALNPTDEELETYLKSNMSKFELDPQIAFEQVFLNPERRGDQIEEDAASILEALNTNASADAAKLGDATLLPLELDLTSATRISQTFGPQFVKAIDQLAPGAWGAPIKSTFGTHLVRVNKREPGRVPALNEVRAAVKREWATEQRKKLEDKRFAELLKRYDVSIERQLNSTTSAEPKQ
jgi:hypothetical protein